MKLREGQIFSRYGRPNQMVIVTTNSSFNKKGALVMGRGSALEAKKKIPGIAVKCGRLVRAATENKMGYGFLPITRHFGIFQVKYAWNHPAYEFLIEASSRELAEFAERYPMWTFNLVFPGVGNGRLPYGKVMRILKRYFGGLDNVVIWRLPERKDNG